MTRRAAQVRPGDADLETAGGVYACVLSAARAESAPRSEPAPDDAVTRVRTLLQLQMVHRCLRAFLSASAPPRLRVSASPRLRVHLGVCVCARMCTCDVVACVEEALSVRMAEARRELTRAS